MARKAPRISTNRRCSTAPAFTLLELLVALAITAAVVVAATAWTSAAIRATEAVSTKPDDTAALEALRRLIEDDLRLGDAKPSSAEDAEDQEASPEKGSPAGEDAADGTNAGTDALAGGAATSGQANSPSGTNPSSPAGTARGPGARGSATAEGGSATSASMNAGQASAATDAPQETDPRHAPTLRGRRDMIEALAGRLRIRTRSRDVDRPGEVTRDYSLERATGRLLLRERRQSGSMVSRPALEGVRDLRCEVIDDQAILLVMIEFNDGRRTVMRFRLP